MIGTRISAKEYEVLEAEAERRGKTPSALLRTMLGNLTAKLIAQYGEPNPKPKGTWPHRHVKAPPKPPKEPKTPVYYQFPVSLMDELKQTALRTSVNPRVLMTQAVQAHIETLKQLED